MLCIGQENEITWKRKFQVLYFYAAWMPFHQKMMIMLEKVEQKFSNIDFFAIDVDYFKGLQKRFNIQSIPTILLFQDLKEVKRLTQRLSTQDFIAVFGDICIY